MKFELLVIVIFSAVTFGGLGYLFVSMTDGINQPAVDPSAVRSAPIDNAPPAGPIVEESAPVVLGSPSITTNDARDEIVVDFFECIPGSGALDFGGGEVSFVMQGLDGNECLIDYQADESAVSCRVPSTIGVLRFSVGDGSPDLGTIESYCQVEAG